MTTTLTINDLAIDDGTRRRLFRAGIGMAELLAMTETDLGWVKGIGEKRVAEIKAAMQAKGLRLARLKATKIGGAA